jgi:hypothetical protein
MRVSMMPIRTSTFLFEPVTQQAQFMLRFIP